MSNKIIKFYPKNSALSPDSVLEQAVGQYQDVLILGWNKEGYLDPRATLSLKVSDMLWLIESFKNNLLNGKYESEEP